MTSRKTARRIFTIFMSIGVLLLLGIIGAATYLTIRPPAPLKFTPPVIWSVPYTGGAPRLEFEI